MNQERLRFAFNSAPEPAPTQNKKSLRKPIRGIRGTFAAAAVGVLTGLVTAAGAQAENTQNHQEPQT